MAKSNEPIWWSLFSAGGMIAAMVFPILIVITGILVPLELVGDDPLNFERIHSAVSHPFIKLVFFIVIIQNKFLWIINDFSKTDLGKHIHLKAFHCDFHSEENDLCPKRNQRSNP